MQRAAVLWRASPGRLVAALFVLMLAAVMAVGSGANFNSTSSNVGNVVTAGVISHTNNSASLNITKLMPGTPKSGTISLTNTGDDAAHSYVKVGNINDTAVPGGALSPALDVTIEVNGTPVGPAVKLASVGTVDLGAWPGGATRNVKFTFLLPDTGTGGSDNIFQGSSVTADFDWELTS